MRLRDVFVFLMVTNVVIVGSACDSTDPSGKDLCLAKVCDSPPASLCQEGELTTYHAIGQCNAISGECEYEQKVVVCEHGCENGQCKQIEPCVDEDCVQPPQNECVNEQELRIYESKGQCSQEGSCEYSSTVQHCEKGCQDGRCVSETVDEDKCKDVVCNQPPADKCKDTKQLEVFAKVGICDKDTGECQYDAEIETCPGNCQDDRCVESFCKEKECLDPPPNTCKSETLLESYPDVGLCDDMSGECIYSAENIHCEHGCLGGECKQCHGDENCVAIPDSRCTQVGELVEYNSSCTESGECIYTEQEPKECKFGCVENESQCSLCSADKCWELYPNMKPMCTGQNSEKILEFTVACVDNGCEFESYERRCPFGCRNNRCNDCEVSRCKKSPKCSQDSRVSFTYLARCENNDCAYTEREEICEFGCSFGVCNRCTLSECTQDPVCREGNVIGFSPRCETEYSCGYDEEILAYCDFGCADAQCNACTVTGCLERLEEPICIDGKLTKRVTCIDSSCDFEELEEEIACAQGCRPDGKACEEIVNCVEDSVCALQHKKCDDLSGEPVCTDCLDGYRADGEGLCIVDYDQETECEDLDEWNCERIVGYRFVRFLECCRDGLCEYVSSDGLRFRGESSAKGYCKNVVEAGSEDGNCSGLHYDNADGQEQCSISYSLAACEENDGCYWTLPSDEPTPVAQCGRFFQACVEDRRYRTCIRSSDSGQFLEYEFIDGSLSLGYGTMVAYCQGLVDSLEHAGTCTGAPINCNDYADQPTCLDVGCNWEEAQCRNPEGENVYCSHIPLASLCEQANECGWATYSQPFFEQCASYNWNCLLGRAFFTCQSETGDMEYIFENEEFGSTKQEQAALDLCEGRTHELAKSCSGSITPCMYLADQESCESNQCLWRPGQGGAPCATDWSADRPRQCADIENAVRLSSI